MCFNIVLTYLFIKNSILNFIFENTCLRLICFPNCLIWKKFIKMDIFPCRKYDYLIFKNFKNNCIPFFCFKLQNCTIILFTLRHNRCDVVYTLTRDPSNYMSDCKYSAVNCIFLTFERTCVKILLERFFLREERNCQLAALYLKFVSYLRKILQKCTICFFIVNKSVSVSV